MIVINFLDIGNYPAPATLTIGMFDGLHLGHEELFKKMISLNPSFKKIVITFENSPKDFLINKKEKKLLSLEKKLLLLEKNGIDMTIIINFSKSIASLSYLDFLKLLKQKINFLYLVLGKNAAFGHNKEGEEKNIKKIEMSLGFSSIFLDNLQMDEEIISSSTIKKMIEKGKISLASRMLGRSYEIEILSNFFSLSRDRSTLTLINSNYQLPHKGTYLFHINDSPIFFKGIVKNTQIEIRLDDKINIDLKKNLRLKISNF